VSIPVACTLTSEGARDRVEEWRRFLRNSIGATESPNQRELRLRLSPSSDVLLEAVHLAQREKACCAFFEFTIEVHSDARWLVVSVPPEATSILSDFSHLLPDSLQPSSLLGRPPFEEV
jgi:hypothetical protein